jgi:predicted NBD/HSP70 family sugar kinase
MAFNVDYRTAAVEYVKAGLDLIKAAFWPGVVVLGGWKFRAEIQTLLTGLSSLKVAGIEAIFDKTLAGTQSKLPPETLDAAKDSEGFQNLAELAETAPSRKSVVQRERLDNHDEHLINAHQGCYLRRSRARSCHRPRIVTK